MPPPIRTEPRYSVVRQLVLRPKGSVIPGETANVSFAGLLARFKSDDDLTKLEPRALVPFDIALDVEIISLTGTITHVAHHRRGAAVGISLFAVGAEAKDLWDTFVGRVRADLGVVRPEQERLPVGAHFEPLLYRNSHQVAVLRVYFASVAELFDLADRDASDEVTFIRTDEPVKVGDEVGLQLVHPNSDDIFEVSCFVTRIVDQHGLRGIEVESLDLDEDRRARLREFIEDGVEQLFDEPSIRG